MSRYPSRKPPRPLGDLTLSFYDNEAWELAREEAAGWQIDLGLYVEYALRHYFKAKLGKLRLARWRHDQDMKDPANRAIHDYLAEFDPQPEPEYMKDEYLPKSKRKAKS